MIAHCLNCPHALEFLKRVVMQRDACVFFLLAQFAVAHLQQGNQAELMPPSQ